MKSVSCEHAYAGQMLSLSGEVAAPRQELESEIYWSSTKTTRNRAFPLIKVYRLPPGTDLPCNAMCLVQA